MRSQPSIKARALRCVLPALQILLAVATVGSLVVIAATEELRPDLSSSGLKHALDIFAFPLSCIAALVAVTGLEVAIDQLIESARQSAEAAWESVKSSFLAFSRDKSQFPFSAFNAQSFPSIMRAPKFADSMFAVEIPLPTLTLHRLLDPSSLGRVDHFPLQKELKEQLIRLDQIFDQLCTRAKVGNEKWIGSFVDLGVLVRQIRQHLIVQTSQMSNWAYQPVLEVIDELGGKRICPSYSSSYLPNISSEMRIELLCVARVLLFEGSGHQYAIKLVDIAHRVGQLWANADTRLKQVLESQPLDKLWHEPHQLVGSRIEV